MRRGPATQRRSNGRTMKARASTEPATNPAHSRMARGVLNRSIRSGAGGAWASARVSAVVVSILPWRPGLICRVSASRACTTPAPVHGSPATASGPDPGERARRAAVVAAGAMADAVIRNIYGDVGKGPGLRGGAFTVKGERFTLRAVRFTADTSVSGTGTYRGSDGAVRARLSVSAPGGRPVQVALAWSQRSTLGTGRIGSGRVTFPAP